MNIRGKAIGNTFDRYLPNLFSQETLFKSILLTLKESKMVKWKYDDGFEIHTSSKNVLHCNVIYSFSKNSGFYNVLRITIYHN